MLYSCTRMATVSVKGLINIILSGWHFRQLRVVWIAAWVSPSWLRRYVVSHWTLETEEDLHIMNRKYR